MRKSDFLFSIFLVPIDGLALILAALATYYLRFSALVNFRPIIYEIPFYQYLVTVFFIALFWLPIFGLAGLYRFDNRREIIKIFFACTTGTMVIILFMFFQHELFSSRFIILVGWLLAIFFIWFFRKISRGIKKIILKKANIRHRIILVGDNKDLLEIKKFISRSLEYSLIDWAKDFNVVTNDYLKSRKNNLDELIIIDSNLSQKEKIRILSLCDEENISFRYLADPFDAKVKNIDLEFFFGLPLIVIKRTSLEGWGRVAKRIFDISGAILFLLILSLFFIIIPILIIIDSSGPVFVFLKRVGRKERIFKLIKFRSMTKDAESMKEKLLSLSERDGLLFKMKDDPRITKIGKFIRQTSIDEIPQFINVIKGEMSLVGPRPHEPAEVAQYQGYQKKLLFIKPGVTGLAQLSGRANLSFEDEAKIDLYYVENWSFVKDLEIILKTIPLVIFRKGAA